MEISDLEVVCGFRLFQRFHFQLLNYSTSSTRKQQFIGNFQIFCFDKAFADSIERLFLQGIFAVNKYVNATLPPSK